MRCAKYKNSYLILAAFLAQAAISRDAFAYKAMNGLGNVASSSIRVVKPASVRINGIHDMVVGSDDMGRDIVWTNKLCVASSHPSRSYAIKAMGSLGLDGDFVLLHHRNRLVYKVEWSTTGGNSVQTATLQSGSAHAVSGGAVNDFTLCNGNYSNAKLVITIPSGNARKIEHDGYTETLTLMVSAN